MLRLVLLNRRASWLQDSPALRMLDPQASSLDIVFGEIDRLIAETSARMCPRLKKSMACKWANDGARILNRASIPLRYLDEPFLNEL